MPSEPEHNNKPPVKASTLKLLAAMLLVIAPSVVAVSFAESLHASWGTLTLISIGVIGLLLLRRINRG